MIAMTDEEDDSYTKAEVLDILHDTSGQSYILASRAWELLEPFSDEVVGDFVVEHDSTTDDPESFGLHDAGFALSNALRKVQRPSEEARGFVNTWPHEMLLTFSDVSEILVEALGGEPSDYTAGGAGFTADGRHDDDLDTLDELMEEPTEA